MSIGDKPSSFLHSHEWIGSFEIGYFLAEQYNIEWKNLHLASANDLSSNRVAKQISEHFDKQGTPIMLGGGNLAYTVLGIDWNEEHQEVQYLILDPHLYISSSSREIKERVDGKFSTSRTQCRPISLEDSFRKLLVKEDQINNHIRCILNHNIAYGNQRSNRNSFKPCQWRRVSSFAKGCFYNLCLPQKPGQFI